mmetsp:Transcript_12892/g.32559  ORF Transcript_12892/g.32559 Transcript_12892/m.32559 type:complete len:310 (-) Transcript_12892:300-1229(-)
MRECVADGDAFVRVEREHLSEEVGELVEPLPVARVAGLLLELPVQIACHLGVAHRRAHGLLGDRVRLLKEEGHVDVVVKMLVHEGALLEHLLGEWPLEVHHQFQHLVVRVPSKGDVSREELVDDAPHAPHVHGVAVGQPQNHLRGPVEARDEVGRQVVVPSVHGAAEVTELHLRVRRVHQNVVGLDVGVEDPARSQQLERRQQLKRVGLHGVQVDTHASAELLHDLPQVHAQRLKDHADVVAVLEGVDQVDAVLLAPRIRPGQLLQNAHFLLRRLAHHLVRPHHLDRVLLRAPFPIPVATSIATAFPLE